MRRPLVIGNWKMNGSGAANIALVEAIAMHNADVSNADMAICAPFVYLSDIAKMLKDSSVVVNMQL
jgi:triosephosphate isomerase